MKNTFKALKTVLAVHTRHDDVLGLIAPVLLAAAHPTALVVDLDAEGIPYRGQRTLSDLVEDGPTLGELRPGRTGLAVLPNGGAEVGQAMPIIKALVESWPQIVIRTRKRLAGFPNVEIVPMIPGVTMDGGPCVWVKTGLGRVVPGKGPVVGPPSRRATAAVLAGRTPVYWGRKPWRAVWEWPWE